MIPTSYDCSADPLRRPEAMDAVRECSHLVFIVLRNKGANCLPETDAAARSRNKGMVLIMMFTI